MDLGVIVKDVFGGAVSITQLNEAGVESTFPAASLARTSNVFVPSDSPG